MGLRTKIAISLSAVLILVVLVATHYHLRTSDEQLNRELERRAGIYSQVVVDETAQAYAFREDSLGHFQDLLDHFQHLPWIGSIGVHTDDQGLPVLAHGDAARVGRGPYADHVGAIREVLETRTSKRIQAGEPGGPCHLTFASANATLGRPTRGAVVVLELCEQGLVDETWTMAGCLGTALALGVNGAWSHVLDSHEMVQDICERFAQLEEVTAVEVFDASARIVAHTRRERIGGAPSERHRQYILGLFDVGGTRVELSREKERYVRFAAVRLSAGEDVPMPVAVVEIAMNTAPISAGIAAEARRSIITLLIVVAAACVAIYFTVGHLVLRPIARLSEATRDLAEGAFDPRVALARKDEVGRLALQFDDMVGRLRATTVSRDFMETVLDSLSDALLVTDERGRILRANPAALRVTGREPPQILGLPLTEVLRPASGDLDRGGPPSPGLVATADGRRVPVIFSASDLVTTQGGVQGRVWILSDMSDQEQARADLEASRRALERAQRVEAIGRLAGGVAHDLNNVLAAVIGHADLLLQALEPGSETREDAREIRKAAERAAKLTSQLLAFGRRQVLRPRDLDLNELVEDLLGMLRRLTGTGVDLVTELEPDLGRVHLDPTRIEQVVVNLVVNARDAMPDGGRITIETKHVELTEAEARAHELADGGPYVVLAVWDTGVGIDAETQAHMYEPFFTTKAADAGTGLGLSTVHGIVKQSGGAITCFSELGEGTRFALVFPCVDAAAPSAESNGSPEEPAPGGRSTVLLVDDEEAVRKYCRRYLESSGYEVIEVADAQTAEQRFLDLNGIISLIVMDIRLPDGNGREMLGTMRGARPDLPAILISGHAESQGTPITYDLDVDFLQKPFTGPELLRAVRAALERA